MAAMAYPGAGRREPAGRERRPPAPSKAPRSLLLFLLTTLAAAASLPAASSQQDWTVVTDFSMTGAGVEVTRVGGPQQPFPRSPPRTLDPQLLTDFAPAFNLLQDVAPAGDNMFTDTAEQVCERCRAWVAGVRQPTRFAAPPCQAVWPSHLLPCSQLLQYVATIHHGFVEGEGGLVYDDAGRAYHPPHFFFARTSPLLPLPQRSVAQVGCLGLGVWGRLCRDGVVHAQSYISLHFPITCTAHLQAAASCERFSSLASVVQRYGHMYYHFVEEALPRWVQGGPPDSHRAWGSLGAFWRHSISWVAACQWQRRALQPTRSLPCPAGLRC